MIHLSLFTLFFFPAFTISGQIIRSILVATFLMFTSTRWKEKLFAPGILLLSWFAWAIIVSYNEHNFLMSLFGYSRRFEGIITWILAISFALLFWRTSSLDKLFITCLFIISVCLYFMIKQPEIYRDIIFGHISIAAFVTIFSCMMIASHPAWILISLPFVYLTQNRSMIAGIGLAIAIYLFINRKTVLSNKKTVAAIGLSLILLGVFAYPKLKHINPNSLGSGVRTKICKEAFDLIIMNPVLGYGLDTQSTILSKNIEEHEDNHLANSQVVKIPFVVDRCHNFFMDILLQTGVVGLLLWILILTRMVYTAFTYQSARNLSCLYGMAGFIGFSSLNPFGVPAMFLMCLCILGIERHYE